MFLVIWAHVFQLEAFRQVVVHLNGTQLPATTDGILHHEIQFRTVECSFTIFHFRLQALFFASFHDSPFCLFPVFIATDVFFAVFLVTQRNLCFKVFQTHRSEHDRDDVHHAEELIFHLVRTAEDVRIILCKATYTSQSVQLTTLLVTTYRTEFSNTQRQVTVRTRRVLVNHTVMRTVHRFQEVFFAFFRSMDRLECIFTIFCIVTWSHIQQFVTDRRTHYFLIVITCLNTTEEVLQTDTQGSTFRQPHRKSLTDCIREHEQIHFLTNLTVVTFLGFFQHYQIFIQHFLFRESDTIDTCHLFAVFLTSPVSTSYWQQLNSLNRSSRQQVRTTTKVGKRTLSVCTDVTIFQFRNQLTLVSLTSVTKHFQGIFLWNALANQFFLLGS